MKSTPTSPTYASPAHDQVADAVSGESSAVASAEIVVESRDLEVPAGPVVPQEGRLDPATVVPPSPHVLDALIQAVQHLDQALEREGKGRRAPSFIQQTIERQGGLIMLERVLQEVKRETAEVEQGLTGEHSW